MIKRKNVFVFGSTGSIGTQTLDVIRQFPERYQLVGMTAGTNAELFISQLKDHHPKFVQLSDEAARRKLEKRVRGTSLELALAGDRPADLVKVLKRVKADIAVNAVCGGAGIEATFATLDAGVDLALANKESVVMAYDLMKKHMRGSRSRLLPVDSEPNAVFQAMLGEKPRSIKNIWLTASGGPLRGMSLKKQSSVTAEQALKHPRWKMGPKITIDSATLMNKGLEVIETARLFNMPVERVKVVVHPQSLVHAMIELTDGTFKAVISETDMRYAILFALSYPDRLTPPAKELDLPSWGSLSFEEPDHANFPCLGLAMEAARVGSSCPAVLSIANETAVKAFLEGQIRLTDIAFVVEKVLGRHNPVKLRSLPEIDELVRATEAVAAGIIQHRVRK